QEVIFEGPALRSLRCPDARSLRRTPIRADLPRCRRDARSAYGKYASLAYAGSALHLDPSRRPARVTWLSWRGLSRRLFSFFALDRGANCFSSRFRGAPNGGAWCGWLLGHLSCGRLL